ncbi:hypothetical protein CONPUDRAFT_95480 [Coniophora puteana RWD-64-598 SS2]|uniref:Uncharacterized protein n=1 Tax=Coniophora puteana (strain RWD-64-598) TaxID=741705 RepID=A0A5M3N5K3_CONPW|nr:uncharacterized protein CONPUDRAFT_95480 [Coniophora puteana RWD-64-598 SS2]EIW86702.1 hypothetical protein CONPUDRAFT_95480 [Coniophora puteana RWD-64-598 SS2]
MSSSFASSFAPYTPPPDDSRLTNPSGSTVKSKSRPWFPSHGSSLGPESSYQSGGIPTFNNVTAPEAAQDPVEDQRNQWQTRLGFRVDILAAFSYILGPISALAVLILETHNDYVRFHAYQSALLMTPLVSIRILASLLGFWAWLCTMLTLLVLCAGLFMAFQAFVNGGADGLSRYHVPTIGPLAEQWVSEE